jgi:hypothetical protein
MIYAKILCAITVILVVVYYIFVVLQSFGIIRFCHENITFPRVLIPFYYFFK